MARENTQHKLDRVRSPRVQITYDVEIGDAGVGREDGLPPRALLTVAVGEASEVPLTGTKTAMAMRRYR